MTAAGTGKKLQHRHDWAAIKRAFVEGVIDDGKLIYPGPSKLNELFGAPRTKISERSNREGWETERALRQRGVAAAAEVQKASILAAEEAMEAEARTRAAEQGVQMEPELPATPAAPQTPVTYADEVPLPSKPVHADPVRRTLDSSAVALATTTAAFDAKAVKIAEAAMTVGAKILLGREEGGGDGKPPTRRPLSPKEYRETVDGIRIAHAIGRLALGQTTDNQGHSSPDGTPVKVDAEMSVDVRNSGYDKLSPAELARLYAEALRACPEDGAGQEAPGAHKGAPRP
ncbi:hypothetical protein [Azospirillum argentinense]|uniref:Uncharacterized protein n=1 Tax=Azospirillum brasilense TaxID=192 RepID=A0A4D8QKM2_AZOBR|nr:hypothetical protein [Azospirillum argentinense]QCO07409.1 hypothetical protein D3867_36665 [Azospirillum argentinense]